MLPENPINNKWFWEEIPLKELRRIKLDLARPPRVDQTDVGNLRAFVLSQDIRNLEDMINDWRPVSAKWEPFVDLLTRSCRAEGG